MELKEFYYDLPEELIAQVPIKKRDESRLMVLDRKKQTIEHKVFKDILDYLQPGDCLVRNNTKVIPARIYGKKETGAHVEFLLLNRIEGDIWECIVRPGNKLHVGDTLEIIIPNKLDAYTFEIEKLWDYDTQKEIGEISPGVKGQKVMIKLPINIKQYMQNMKDQLQHQQQDYILQMNY